MKISAGVDISMAVSTTGQVYSWGSMKGGRIGLGLAEKFVNIPRRVTIHDDKGDVLMAVDCDCCYVHSLIVGLNGTVHVCGGVGVDGMDDGYSGEEGDNNNGKGSGTPRMIPNFNIWHRVAEPKEHVKKKEKWKKYGKYEVKGRSKAMSEAS
jgi:alpha-tubulin suppressor-like RCC1 family protein